MTKVTTQESLCDLLRTREATPRHKEAEGSSYYRHFHMGLLGEHGSPKPGLEIHAGADSRRAVAAE
jgi:hypothetical protein